MCEENHSVYKSYFVTVIHEVYIAFNHGLELLLLVLDFVANSRWRK